MYRSNRDFLLLWTGQTASAIGSSVASIAYPLVALAATGSAAQEAEVPSRYRDAVARRRVIALTVAAVVGVAVGTVALAAPSVAAAACPQCYGLSGLGGGVYADRDDIHYRQMIDAAGQRIAAFYGGQEHHGRVLICASAACYDRIGGGIEKGRALPIGTLMLSPAGATETIATHELSHLELHERLGAARDRVPHWFDEGLAVLVSDDDRYLKPAGEADRCRLPYAEAVAVVHTDWAAATAGGNDHSYLLAACVVSHWTAEHGGPPAVLQLITDLRTGKPFKAPN